MIQIASKPQSLLIQAMSMHSKKCSEPWTAELSDDCWVKLPLECVMRKSDQPATQFTAGKAFFLNDIDHGRPLKTCQTGQSTKMQVMPKLRF